MSAPAAKIVSTELLENKDAKWINLVKIQYQDPNGQLRTWEGVQRPGRPSTSPVDAVQMLTTRELPGGPEVLLERQFRAPAGRVVIEFPAGFVDAGETVEQAALRELKEETGYVGEVVAARGGRPIFYSSPGSSSSTTLMVNLKVDPDREENKNPKPELEDGEFIEPFWVPFKDLYDECRRLEAEGFAIDGKVGVFAEGIEVTKMWHPS
ncbi:putative ADP-ribose pyrophosphatase [Xylariaceae sp. FL0804]|nr:putative ADP-ribose pyrophosphatase [Xylariaceae sp. FL0804]